MSELNGERGPGRPSPNMLVMSRAVNEALMVGDDAEVTVLAVAGGRVRLGISTPAGVGVLRRETYLSSRVARPLEPAERAELPDTDADDAEYVEIEAYRKRRYQEVRRAREAERDRAFAAQDEEAGAAAPSHGRRFR